MLGKVLIAVAGGAIGYVLGAKAGRDRYDQIKGQASRVWHDPRVQDKASQAADNIKDGAAQAANKAKDGAAQAVDKAAEKVPGGWNADAAGRSSAAEKDRAARGPGIDAGDRDGSGT